MEHSVWELRKEKIKCRSKKCITNRRNAGAEVKHDCLKVANDTEKKRDLCKAKEKRLPVQNQIPNVKPQSCLATSKMSEPKQKSLKFKVDKRTQDDRISAEKYNTPSESPRNTDDSYPAAVKREAWKNANGQGASQKDSLLANSGDDNLRLSIDSRNGYNNHGRNSNARSSLDMAQNNTHLKVPSPSGGKSSFYSTSPSTDEGIVPDNHFSEDYSSKKQHSYYPYDNTEGSSSQIMFQDNNHREDSECYYSNKKTGEVERRCKKDQNKSSVKSYTRNTCELDNATSLKTYNEVGRKSNRKSANDENGNFHQKREGIYIKRHQYEKRGKSRSDATYTKQCPPNDEIIRSQSDIRRYENLNKSYVSDDPNNFDLNLNQMSCINHALYEMNSYSPETNRRNHKRENFEQRQADEANQNLRSVKKQTSLHSDTKDEKVPMKPKMRRQKISVSALEAPTPMVIKRSAIPSDTKENDNITTTADDCKLEYNVSKNLDNRHSLHKRSSSTRKNKSLRSFKESSGDNFSSLEQAFLEQPTIASEPKIPPLEPPSRTGSTKSVIGGALSSSIVAAATGSVVPLNNVLTPKEKQKSLTERLMTVGPNDQRHVQGIVEDILCEMGEERIVQYKQAFGKLDKESSGIISSKQLRHLLRTLGHNPSDAELTELVNQVDMDENGKIDFNEFIIMIGYFDKANNESEDLSNIFRVFDRDGKGCIDVNELRSIWGDYLLEMAPIEELEEMISTIDNDGNGEINRSEMLELLSLR